MKALLTTATTILFLLGGAALAQTQEHEHGHGNETRPMMEDGGMSDQMMARCRMTMHAELSPHDPAVLLGMKDPLELTDEQVEQFQALADEMRRKATALLTDAQRQQVAQLPEQPQSMMQMHRQMMGRMKGMHGGMDHMQGMGGMDMCAMMMHGMGMHGGQGGMMTQPVGRAALGAEAQAALDQLVASYLAVQQRLAGDAVEGVTAQLAELHDAAHALFKADSAEVQAQARAVAGTVHGMPENLDQAREVFKALSAEVIGLVKLAPPSDTAAPAIYEAHCPMAEASWLQSGREIANPYMGQAMLRCGTIEATLKPGGEG